MNSSDAPKARRERAMILIDTVNGDDFDPHAAHHLVMCARAGQILRLLERCRVQATIDIERADARIIAAISDRDRGAPTGDLFPITVRIHPARNLVDQFRELLGEGMGQMGLRVDDHTRDSWSISAWVSAEGLVDEHNPERAPVLVAERGGEPDEYVALAQWSLLDAQGLKDALARSLARRVWREGFADPGPVTEDADASLPWIEESFVDFLDAFAEFCYLEAEGLLSGR